MTSSQQGDVKAKGVPTPTGVATDSAAPRTTRSCLLNQLRKTRFCVYNTKGNCRYGSECAWAHSEEELHRAPDLSKTRLCVPFMEEGRCDDPDCTFAHGEEELRSTDMFYRKVLCIWNAKGRCRNGENCRFAHGHRQLAPQSKDQRKAPLRPGPQEPRAAPKDPGADVTTLPEANEGAIAIGDAPPGPGATGERPAPRTLKAKGPVQTPGSAGHPHGCTPCTFYLSSRGGCKNGDKCAFCHLTHVPATQQQGQQKEQQRKELGSRRTKVPPPPLPATPSIVLPGGTGASPASVAHMSTMSSAGASSPLNNEPMKIYPVTHTGDEHPGSVMRQAAAHPPMARGDAENLTHQLESLCHQLTALTRRMSNQGAGGLPQASRDLALVASALAPLTVPDGRYNTPGTAATNLTPSNVHWPGQALDSMRPPGQHLGANNAGERILHG